MRIQAINNNYNQNNISHKAHFKPNAYLKEICENVEKSDTLKTALNHFQEVLPKHELEIVDKIHRKFNFLEYIVRNNTTHKKDRFISVEGKNSLTALLASIAIISQNDSFWKKDYCEKLDCFSFLTTTDYERKTNPSETFNKKMEKIARSFTEKN